jgi:Na+-driven multidrug efflux pump
VIALISQWVLQFPLAYILSKHTSLEALGLWWAFPITNIAMMLVSMAWFAHGGWKKTRLTDETEEAVHIAEEAIL